MRTTHRLLVAAVVAASALGVGTSRLVFPDLLAQAAAPPTATATPPAAPASATGNTSSKLMTLSGCVIANPDKPGGFLLSGTDADALSRYRLTGTDVRDYAGKRVELSGSSPKRLQIVGGLYPSANVAAQAGAMDPAKAAMVAATPSAPPLTEFRVRSVRPMPGTCPGR